MNALIAKNRNQDLLKITTNDNLQVVEVGTDALVVIIDSNCE